MRHERHTDYGVLLEFTLLPDRLLLLLLLLPILAFSLRTHFLVKPKPVSA